MRSSEASNMWLLLQLADSAFPTGGFAHSSGLEPAVQLGMVDDEPSLSRFVDDVLWQTGHGSLPLVGAAFDSPERLAELDELCDAFLTSPVGNRASRTLGRAFVSTCADAFTDPHIGAISMAIRKQTIAGHHAPAFGAVTRAVAVTRGEAQRVFLHQVLRGVTSAAVRLGLLGPQRAQRWHHERHELLERV